MLTMLIITLLSAFACLSAAASAAAGSDICRGVYIIATRGHADDGSNYGAMNNFTLEVLSKIPGSTRAYNPYPNLGDVVPIDIKNGSDILTSMIEDYLKKCPDGYIVLVGYSEGAVVTMNTICGNSEAGFLPSNPLPTKYVKNLLTIIAYGDESRVPSQKWNRGTCIKAPGIFPRLDPAACDPYGAVILDYCDHNDPFCCAGGTNATIHELYDERYDAKNLKIVERRYKKATGK